MVERLFSGGEEEKEPGKFAVVLGEYFPGVMKRFEIEFWNTAKVGLAESCDAQSMSVRNQL